MKKYLLLLTLPFSLSLFASDLTLHVLKPHQVDWSSPRGLVISALKNQATFQKDPWGQTWTEINCPELKMLFTVKPKNYNFLGQIFFESQGLEVLFHTFEGHMLSDAEALSHYKTEGQIYSLKFNINSNQCSRIADYFKEFQKYKVDKNFGLPHRPLFAEGASGSSFAASFVEVAGLMDEGYREEWTRGLNVPDKNINVNGFKLLTSADHWAKNQDTQKRILFYDPEKIGNWIESKVKLLPCPDHSLRGVCIDKSFLPPLQTPIWQQRSDSTYRKK